MTAPEPEERYFDRAAETMPRGQLEALQLARLRETVARAMKVPFYRAILDRDGITPESIRTLDDLKRLPFTTKQDMRDNYPLGLAAVPRAEMARIHGSSGTTGKPTFVAYTKNDVATWADLCARFLVAGGLRPEHTCQIAFGYGLFTGGFGLHYGIERVGASIIPASSGNTARQLILLQDLAPDVLIATPSYALNLSEAIVAAGIDPEALSLRYAHFGGEMWTDDMRREIETRLPIKAYNNYGLSEVIGPGVSGECRMQDGMHFQEDHFLVECLDPDTLEPAEDLEYGELVITSLTKEAMPVLRYRTRDYSYLDARPCPCGRTGRKMGRVKGRTDDMLILRGVNVFPSQFEEALLQVEGTQPHYVLFVDRPENLDVVTLRAEVEPELFSDKMSDMQALYKRIDRKVQDITGIRVNLELVPAGTIERSVGKALRVIDRRPLGV